MSNEISNEKEEFVRNFLNVSIVEIKHIQNEYYLKYRECISRLDILEVILDFEMEKYLLKPVIKEYRNTKRYIVR